MTLLALAVGPAAADLCDDGSPSTSTANLEDLLTARQIALGTMPVTACPGLNPNGDQAVTVGEILGGIFLILQRSISADGGGAAGVLSPVVIDVGIAWGSANELVPFNVRLSSSAGLVAGAQIDINFDSQTPIPPHPNPIFGGAPFCDVNPAINKNQSAFAYDGPNGIRGVIISFTNLDLIPEGAVLFTCQVHISALAPTGTYPLPCSNALSSTALGATLPTTCTPRAVEVIEHADLDHYKCYQGSDLKNPRFVKQQVSTTDQLISNDPALALKLKYLCAPVDKNGEGIADPAAHLACYGVKAAAFDPEPKVLVSTQFQSTQFELKKPKLLCLPATKTVLP